MATFLDVFRESLYREQNPFYAEMVEFNIALEEAKKAKRKKLRPYAVGRVGTSALKEWLDANDYRLPKRTDGNPTFITKSGKQVLDADGKPLFDTMLEYAVKKINEEIDRLMSLPCIPPQVDEWLRWNMEREAFEREVFEQLAVDCHDGKVPIEEVLQRHAKLTKPCDLYRFFGKEGQLLYVGISNYALNRAYQHSKNAKWFEQFSYMEREECLSRKHAVEAEKLAIQTEFPLFNIAHSVKEAA